jgi:hypothetical protein
MAVFAALTMVPALLAQANEGLRVDTTFDFYAPPLAAQKYTEWTGWQGTNDSLVQWRSRIQNWGRNISSSCDVEFRVTVDGTLTFKYSLGYQPWAGSNPGGPRSGTAYSVRKDRDHGSAFIDGCRQVTSVTVSNVVSITGGSRPPTTNATGKKREFSRPSIAGVQLDQRCVDLLKAESDALQAAGMTKKLLAWSPLITLAGESNAMHAALFINNTSWTEIAESFSKINKLALYPLATEARKHANSDDHIGNQKAREFWNAMADFYEWQAEQ